MSSQFDETVQAQEAEDDAVDIMSNRSAFVDIEPEGKRPIANTEMSEPDDRAERERVFAMASNASINFPDTNSFFGFLEQSRAYLATGTLPDDGGSPETGAEGGEAPSQGSGA